MATPPVDCRSSCYGFDEVGVFFDWGSLFQKPRTAPQDDAFRAALNVMSIWYAHFGTTVVVVQGQDDYLRVPRSDRGWPTFEEAMAELLKEGNPRCPLVLHTGGTTTAFGSSTTIRQGPPRPPSQFNALIATKTFTNGADVETVKSLYLDSIVEGFGSISKVKYRQLGWADGELSLLASSLVESGTRGRVVDLDLGGNDMASGEALSTAVAAGALVALRNLIMDNCRRLVGLPSNLGHCRALDFCNVDHCISLDALPDSMSECTKLRVLFIKGCPLRSVPDLNLQRPMVGGIEHESPLGRSGWGKGKFDAWRSMPAAL